MKKISKIFLLMFINFLNLQNLLATYGDEDHENESFFRSSALPPEMWGQIADYLDPQSFSRIKRTSKAWNNLCQSSVLTPKIPLEESFKDLPFYKKIRQLQRIPYSQLKGLGESLFEAFPSTIISTLPQVEINIQSVEERLLNKSILEGPSNFSGHFLLTTEGVGQAGQNIYIVNKLTGMTVLGGGCAFDVSCRRDSSVFIVDPLSSLPSYSWEDEQRRTHLDEPRGIITYYNIWDEENVFEINRSREED